jgi:hypothetical protein
MHVLSIRATALLEMTAFRAVKKLPIFVGYNERRNCSILHIIQAY